MPKAIKYNVARLWVRCAGFLIGRNQLLFQFDTLFINADHGFDLLNQFSNVQPATTKRRRTTLRVPPFGGTAISTGSGMSSFKLGAASCRLLLKLN